MNRSFLPETNEYAMEPFCYREDFLSSEECDNCIAYVEANYDLEYPTIGIRSDNEQGTVNLDYRTVLSTSLPDQDFPNLYKRIRDEIKLQNDMFFRFELTGLYEDIQYLRYDEAKEDIPPGHYNWHIDTGGGYASRRKLTTIIQLTDPTEYEGADLEIFREGSMNLRYLQKKGTMITFPSFTPHRVSGIITGTRRCLVLWVGGSPFR